MDERLQLELAACRCFIDSYNVRHGTDFKSVEHRDKPDFLIQDARTREAMGLEVMHLYYDGKEAQMVLGRRSKEPHGPMTLDQLIDKLNSDLVEKVARASKYDFDGRMSLVIRVASPIFDRADFDIYEDDVVVPGPNLFDEIWLLFRDPDTGAFTDLKQIQ